MKFSPSHLDKFFAYVSPEPNSGCWLWVGDCHNKGYAQFGRNIRPRRAHRFSYEAFVGPIPDGLVIDHKCRVRCCVNPDHLEAVTSAENTRRGVPFKKLENHPQRTHCKRGHALVAENLRPYDLARGHRACRLCHLTNASASRRKRLEVTR